MGIGTFTHIPANHNNQDAWAFQIEGGVAIRLEGANANESYGFKLDVAAATHLAETLNRLLEGIE